MKLKYIDALRGIAILLVIAAHTFQNSTSFQDGFFNNIVSQGARGVQLFFIISAFTLFLSFNFRKEKETNVNIKFFIRRFFRIAPMYYIGIIYFLFQNGFGPRYWLGDAENISNYNILANIFFVNDFYPYWITSLVPGGWSIGVEMTFYLIVPILVYKLKSLNSAINFTVITILLSILIKVILSENILISSQRLWDEYLFLYFPNQLPVFSFGIILYFLIIKKDFKLTKINYGLFSIVSVALVLYKEYISSNIPFSFLFLIIIYLLSKFNLKLFVNKITIFIGKVSFSAYLVHFALLYWLSQLNALNFINVKSYSAYILNFLINYLVICIITIIIAYFFYIAVEKTFIKMGKQIIQKIN